MRLAQALARLRFAETVSQDDVDEALRLVEASKDSLNTDANGNRRQMNVSSRIYNLVKSLMESRQCLPDDADEDDEDYGVELSMRKVKERVIAKGFTEDQWVKTLDEYHELDVSNPSTCRDIVFDLPLTDWVILAVANCWKRLSPCLHYGGRQQRQ